MVKSIFQLFFIPGPQNPVPQQHRRAHIDHPSEFSYHPGVNNNRHRGRSPQGFDQYPPRPQHDHFYGHPGSHYGHYGGYQGYRGGPPMGDYRGEPRGYYEDFYYGGRGYGGHSYGGPNHQRNGPNYQEHQMTMSGGVPTVQFELIYFRTDF